MFHVAVVLAAAAFLTAHMAQYMGDPTDGWALDAVARILGWAAFAALLASPWL